jgi:uncharacterized protein YaaN involved in tellurite resistance
MALDEAKEAYRVLEGTLSKGDMTLKKKCSKLERSNEQITLMYHQVVSEKSVLKIDLQVAEKKIQRKEEKIKKLEKHFNAARE